MPRIFPQAARTIAIAVLVCFFTAFSLGQEKTAMLADQTLRSNGRVNPSTLGMEMSIPLAAYPGRGGMGVPISLQYSSKVWRMEYRNTDSPVAANQCHKQYTPRYSELSASGWTTDLSRPYIEYTGWDNTFDGQGNTSTGPPVGGCGIEGSGPGTMVRRITVHLPGGGTHELRPDDNVVTFWPSTVSTVSAAGTYYSADGSNLIYVEGSGTYRLKLPDGSYMDFASFGDSLTTGGQTRTVRYAVSHTDKTGSNTITYNAADSTYPNGSVTDSMGRVIEVPIGLSAPNTPTADNSPQEYQIPGFGSSNITYKLHWKKLKDTTAAESGLTTFSDTLCYKSKGFRYYGADELPTGSCILFEDGYDNYPADWVITNPAEGVFNPIVLTKVELPDGRFYKFGYDILGRVNRIEYPTGGFEAVTYSSVPTVAWETPSVIAQTNFGVVEREVFESSSADPTVWTYGITEQTVAPHGLIVRTTAPDNTKTDQYLIRGDDYTACSEVEGVQFCNGGYGYASTLTGMPFEERKFSSTDQLLSKTVTTWNETSLAISYSNGAYTATADWHPRSVKVEQVIYDPATSQVLSSTTTTDYDGDLNQRATALNSSIVKQYGFSTTAGTLGSLERSTETSYLSGTDYTSRNLRSLPSQVLVKDAAGGIKAKTQISYDDVNFGLSGVFGLPTKTTSWHDIANNLSVNSKVKYDSYGNAIESTDGRGNVSSMAYSGSYGYAYPTSVTTAVPDSTGTHGSNASFTSSTTYDFNTGLPLTSTDANGQTTEMEYEDPLLRPTKVIAPNGAETVTEYGAGTDAASRWVKVTSDIDETNTKYAYTWFDGLGRTWLSQSEDSAGDVFAVTCYDNMGRVSKTSNPFRNVSNSDCSSSLEWTTPAYDDLGRTVSVTTPDGAVVTTAYSFETTADIGTMVTVEDQAGKKRRSVTNALGQLIRVDEPDMSQPEPTPTPTPSPSPTGTPQCQWEYCQRPSWFDWNSCQCTDPLESPMSGESMLLSGETWISTYYSYDTLNNLTTVEQGVQTRTFGYDALSRLKQAVNPESGTINYTYDANSNLATKTDARSIVTTYNYDALNRVKTRTYSDSTPAVSYFYDNLTNAKGKLRKVSSSVSTTEYTGFDILGRVISHKQSTGGNDYTTGYTYNLSGALIEETYPSGRKVKNTLDADGALSLVETKPSGGSYATRAGSFTYNPAGAVTSMQLGNGRWESTVFNNRLQPTQIALGTTQSATDLLKLEYGYGTTDNNGNVQSQKITVPGVTHPFMQTYSYDALNRLESATETQNLSQTWAQTFTFDRYGNRNFDAANTTTLGSCSPAVCNPTISTTNNRITSTGYTYDNAGNTTNDAEGRQFTYDAENKQTLVKDASNNTIGEYFYDGDGKRVKKLTNTSDNIIFIYNAAGKLVEERIASTGALQTSYVYAGSRLLSTETASATSYLTNDHLGSPRINTDATGTVTARHDYHPFGEEITRSDYGSDIIRKQFTGYERDTEVNLDYAKARMFGYQWGRFTSPDPVFINLERVQSPHLLNLYIYSRNNPLQYLDPIGLWEWSAALGGRRSDAEIRAEIDDLSRYQGECLKSNDCADLDDVTSRAVELGGILQQRANIRSGFALAQSVINSLQPNNGSTAAILQSVLKEYGTENDGNDVVLGVRDPSDTSGVAFTKVEGGKRVVAISAGEIGNNTLFATLMHEGAHLQQAGAYLASGTNPPRWQAEFQAYAVASVSAVFRQMAAKLPAASSTYSVSGTQIGQGDWTAQQSETAIKNHLFNLGLMQVNNQGQHSPTPRGLTGAFPGGGKWR